MRVLITGISGLVGRWTAQTLISEGHHVIGLDVQLPSNTVVSGQYFQCDLLDRAGLSRAMKISQPEAIIHLAARTDLNETRQLIGYAANIDGVRNLLEVVGDTKSVRRVIITSSQLVCRVGYIPRRMDEYCPSTFYGKSKVLTEQITKELDGGGAEWIITRPTTVWGPYMGPHYKRMLRMIRRGRYFHCGKSRLLKSYAFAGNIAWQYSRLLMAPSSLVHGRTFYMADYEPLSLRDYADALAEGLGAPPVPTYSLGVARALAYTGDMINAIGWKGFPFNSFRLSNILTEYIFDMSETERVCGSLPTTWRDGVASTCRWYLATEGALAD